MNVSFESGNGSHCKEEINKNVDNQPVLTLSSLEIEIWSLPLASGKVAQGSTQPTF